MHALRHVHELVVAGGTVVDVHPVTEQQVETGAGRFIGVIEEPEFTATDLPNAETRLREAIQDGFYMLEEETEFDFLQHFDEVEELIEKEHELLAGDALLVRRIRAATPPLVMREHTVLRRLRAL